MTDNIVLELSLYHIPLTLLGIFGIYLLYRYFMVCLFILGVLFCVTLPMSMAYIYLEFFKATMPGMEFPMIISTFMLEIFSCIFIIIGTILYQEERECRIQERLRACRDSDDDDDDR